MSIFFTLLTIILVICLAALYFLPSFVAHSRNHKNSLPILIINLFLGWTFVFWVLALTWSLLDGQEATKKTKAEKEKISGWKWASIVMGGLLILFLLAFLATLSSRSPSNNLTQTSTITSDASPSDAGVPISADAFLKGL